MKKYVLIVDDEDDVRELLKDMIESTVEEEVTILEASNGIEGFRLIRNQQFHLLISDLKMPKMDGKGLIESMRTMEKKLLPKSILILSGFLDGNKAGRKVGSVTYMSKPWNQPELETYFREVIDGVMPKNAEGAKAVQFVTCFIEGTLAAVRETAGIEAVKKNVEKKNEEDLSHGDISAVISFTSSKFKGCLIVSFEKDCFLSIANKMSDEEFSDLSPSASNAAGILSEQILERAKPDLSALGFQLENSVTSIFIGEGHQVKHLLKGSRMAIEFTTDAGTFCIETILSPK